MDIKRQKKRDAKLQAKLAARQAEKQARALQDVDCEIAGDNQWSIRIEYEQEQRALKQQQVLTIVDEEDEEDEVA